MNKRKLLAITGVLVMILSGCANTSDVPASTEAANTVTSEATAASEASSEATEATSTATSAAIDSSDAASKVLDEAIAGKIPVHVKEESGKESTYYIPELPHDKTDALSYYEAGERIDLDNDGEKELVIEGPYGGIYVDARGQEVYELARGDGTALQLYHADYNGKTYICHVDNSHGGREIFKMDQFNGKGEIVESTELVAEFWDTGYFDESADCHFGNEKISTDRYLELRKEIFDY